MIDQELLQTINNSNILFRFAFSYGYPYAKMTVYDHGIFCRAGSKMLVITDESGVYPSFAPDSILNDSVEKIDPDIRVHVLEIKGWED